MPLQLAVLPLQFPVLAATDMPVYMPPSGLLQFGAFVQLRPLVTDTEPTLLAQETAGAVIAVPSPTNVLMLAQVSVYVRVMLELLLELLLELCATDELLGVAGVVTLDEDTTTVLLELCARDEELLGNAFELLDRELELLLGTEFELLLGFELELLGTAAELELS